ncbi:hypothetical protein H1S01_13425 [Heliobacterium chlorum]|uniref:Uncharacterized protein n=1 Tax=Heliobacterium chlorum TaxID=2698 RepID=A0ABR7T5J3_HELCL|nr:hypothetical protein [Heliobacterium chlorum]MBC9785502.1 hypothetical protein [Heliobacterium chlorum]
MANKQRGFVDIDLDRPRKLRYTLNALAEIEDKLGVTVTKLSEVTLGIKSIRTFLWAGLIHEDANLNEKDVGSWVDFDNIEYVQAKIAEAFETATRKND